MLSISKSFPAKLRASLNDIIQSQIKANKNLGQNFLNDYQICDQIALSCGDVSNSLVIEVGPGLGHLTQAILELHPGVEIIAVEKDLRFLPILNAIGEYYERCILSVVEGNALDFNFQDLIKQGKNTYIIANLPYNIGTELLFKWLDEDFLKRISNITVMLQKEVASRVVARKDFKAYSWLSIVSQLLCDVEVLFDVPKEAFLPMPKVLSSVISFKPKASVMPHNMKNLKKLCRGFFLHRRKTIKSIISNNSYFNYLLPVLSPEELMMRPENLDIKTFCELSLLQPGV